MPPGLSSRKAESPPEVFFDAPAYLALAHLLQSLARSHNCDETVFGIVRRFCASSRCFQPGAQPARWHLEDAARGIRGIRLLHWIWLPSLDRKSTRLNSSH